VAAAAAETVQPCISSISRCVLNVLINGSTARRRQRSVNGVDGRHGINISSSSVVDTAAAATDSPRQHRIHSRRHVVVS